MPARTEPPKVLGGTEGPMRRSREVAYDAAIPSVKRTHDHAVCPPFASPSILPALLAASLLAVVPEASAVNPPHGAIVSADPANFTPNITNGRVNALTVVGNRVIVGGTFTTVQNAGSSTNLTRNYLFSFDATTGVVDPNFRPSLNKAVEALAPGPDGTSVYVGGRHTTINGSSNFDRLSRLRLSDGGW